MHMYIHTYVYTYIYIHTHTHTQHTLTHVQNLPWWVVGLAGLVCVEDTATFLHEANRVLLSEAPALLLLAFFGKIFSNVKYLLFFFLISEAPALLLLKIRCAH